MAYTSLCRPILEYADTLWDPATKGTAQNLELVQNDAIRFISSLRGRDACITDTRSQLELRTLAERRRSHRLNMLTRILSDEERHRGLSSDYDEIVEDRTETTMTTRAAARGQLNSISATNTVYHNSFLPRTIRDMRGVPN